MKPSTIALAGAAVIVGGVALLSRGWNGNEDQAAASDPTGRDFKHSERPAPVIREGEKPTEVGPKLSQRDTEPKNSKENPEAVLRRILGPEKYAEIQAARDAARQTGTRHPETGDGPVPAVVTDSRTRAFEALREDVRTAIATDPEGWTSTYKSLYDDYISVNHPNLAQPVRGGRPTSGDDGGGSDGGAPPVVDVPDGGTPDQPLFFDEETLRQAEQDRKALESVRSGIMSHFSTRQSRFRQPE
ncbi:hypothetical protein HAHE_16560 [Haloferula helveola]|uniref:Uncharacterized protein n=1 Tax=Haloferula helveola TaxID=490095 RepID=A0ABN6H2E5_9BACT|nr:hypothetical protein HAHE_16560 [Haloferula helveola]